MPSLYEHIPMYEDVHLPELPRPQSDFSYTNIFLCNRHLAVMLRKQFIVAYLRMHTGSDGCAEGVGREHCCCGRGDFDPRSASATQVRVRRASDDAQVRHALSPAHVQVSHAACQGELHCVAWRSVTL